MTKTGYKTGVYFPKSVILFSTKICNAMSKTIISKSVKKVLLITFLFLSLLVKYLES